MLCRPFGDLSRVWLCYAVFGRPFGDLSRASLCYVGSLVTLARVWLCYVGPVVTLAVCLAVLGCIM